LCMANFPCQQEKNPQTEYFTFTFIDLQKKNYRSIIKKKILAHAKITCLSGIAL
jgi:hypothetical protein